MREVDELAAHQTLLKHRPKVDDVSACLLPSSRSPHTEPPGQLGEQSAGDLHLRGREISEVLGSRDAYRAVRTRRAWRLPMFLRTNILELHVYGHTRRGSNNDARPFAE